MSLLVQAADSRFFIEAPRCDFSFVVDAAFDPQIGRSMVDSPVLPLPPQRKAYGLDPDDYRDHLDAADKALFVARRAGAMAGYLAIALNWNGYALVEDLAVDTSARRHGIGTALLDVAIDWARRQDLPGLMLETQNNNLAACRLYERHGFVLGGIDRCLYRGLDPDTREVALFWYRTWDRGGP